MDLKIKLIDSDARYPEKSLTDAACFDVFAHSINETQEYIEYGLGFSTEIPDGWEGIIRPRSSISKYDLLLCNSPATIDQDYRGEWLVRFKCIPNNTHLKTNEMSHKTFINPQKMKIYNVGDKIAQITFSQVPEINFITDEDLSQTQRNDGGFGSTGS